MQHIKLQKIAGEPYSKNTFKSYEIIRNGTIVGSIAQDFGQRWEVVTPNLERVSVHTTIKAAVRVAGRVH